MLKNKTKIIAILVILILLISNSFVFAENNEATTNSDQTQISEDTSTGDEVMPISTDDEDVTNNSSAETSLQEESYQKSDAYLADDTINIDKIIDGNVFAFGNTVTINSQIGGDAFIFADKVVIEENGYVFSNLFVMANTVEIKGVVYDVYANAKTITISNGYIYRDMKANCDTLNVYGTVGRNVFVNSNSISFVNPNSQVTGMINGNLSYSAKSEMTFPEGSVLGETKYTPITVSTHSAQDYLTSLGSTLALVIILWLVSLWIAPKFLENTKTIMEKNKLFIVLSGLIGLIAIPFVSVILLLLGITANVAIILLGIYIILLVLSKSIFVITANNILCSKLKINKNIGILGMLIISGIVVWALCLIPYVGGWISFITIIIGLGILFANLFPKKNNEELEKNESTENSERTAKSKKENKETKE